MDKPVAVVTGASRGAGRGIAAALLAKGWRVYVTGRTVTDPGGGGIAVRVDHSDDKAVGALFGRVADEAGRLDLLVNNAAAIHDELTNPKPFWEKPIELADVLDVGLRSAYVASWFAAPLLVAGDKGLIVFTSSPGSGCYMHGPAYGAQKAGVDKLAADMAVDFRDTAVSTVSIWMGILLTEKLRAAFT
ncbi:MAG TPA: SDR family NAD(P)-dependent oxidoreductase, partial [Mycobacterium sp.]|nr:SDR family NAD(P)-dependent oxidoreductase [Mycobacterium sp.]